MKSIAEMSLTELEQEAARRMQLQARGLPFDTPALELPRTAEQAEADDARLEKAIVANADKQLRALGFRVINTSQPRHAKFLTPGIPDRLYVHRARAIAFWWEAKSATGRQEPAQRDFQEDCEACEWAYVLGTDRELYAWMVAQRIAVRGADGLLYTPSLGQRSA